MLQQERADYTNALNSYVFCLKLCEERLGPDHSDTASSLNNLAQLLLAISEFGKAEPLIRRALAIDEARHGLEHPNVATSLNNLATLLQATNRRVEAEKLMRRALAIVEDRYGTEHPNVAMYLNNLAVLLTVTDRMEEAELLMRRVVMILLKLSHQGYNHPLLQTRLESYEILLHARGFSEGEIQAKLQDLQRAI